MVRERTVLVRLKADPNDFIRGTLAATAALKTLTSQVDKTNDRAAWMAQGFLAIGPALAPIGAVAVPAMVSLTSQFGAAAAAAGVAITALNGVGDGLKALNDYQLAPTAENLAKMQDEMVKLGPAGADFVRFLDGLSDQLKPIQTTAREGLFPGLQDGIESLMTRLPEVKSLVSDNATAMGQLSSEAGSGLAGPEFQNFFDYLDRNARPLLLEMGRTIGNFVEGMADLLVAFEPLTNRFSDGFLNMSRSFADWAEGLDQNRSFQDFVSYIEDSLPKVQEFLSSVIEAFVGLARAVAPIGDVMLPIVSHLLELFAQIVDTPLGTTFLGLAAATSAYGRAAALASVSTGGFLKSVAPFGVEMGKAAKASASAATSVGALARGMAPAAGAAGLLIVALSDLDDQLGLANTSMGAFAGLMVGGGWGAAIGAGIGLTQDFASANNDLEAAIRAADRAIETGAPARMRAELERLEDISDRLANDNSFGANVERISVAFGSMFGENENSQRRSRIDLLRSKLNALHSEIPGIAHLLGQALPSNIGLTENAFTTASQSSQEFRQELTKVSAALDGRADFRDYQAAIDDFRMSIRQATKDQKDFLNPDRSDFNTNIAIGRELQQQFDAIAGSALASAESMKGLERVRFLDKARDQFIQAAREAGITREAARQLARQFGLVDQIDARPGVSPHGIPETRRGLKDVNDDFKALDNLMGGPTITANATNAKAVIQDVFRAVRALTANPWQLIVGGAQGRAMGGPIVGPGTGTSDSIPAWLSNGEHVWTAREVANAGGHAAMEAMRSQFRYASGGPVQVSLAPGDMRLHPSDVRSLTSALLSARPISGDWKFYGQDGYQTAKRDAARRAAGGYSF